MRQIVLDTETTGLEWRQGHRVIEIGCVEIIGRKLSGRRLHRYVNPEREIDAGAQAVHGITGEFLQDKPRFAAVADDLVEFLQGAELVIHNAAFDVGFLNYEFGLMQRAPVEQVCAGVVDTLRLAKDMFPGRRASLDALCERFEIDNSSRTLHGALLDAELLAEVYLAMTRGQESLVMELDAPIAVDAHAEVMVERLPLAVLRASDEELAEHARVLQEIGKESKGRCLWLAEPLAATV